VASVSGTAIDALIKSHLAPWFKGHGFRPKGRFFTRSTQDVVHVASVQASQGNAPDVADFYVNLGVEWQEVRRLWTGMADDEPNPARAPCYINGRLQAIDGAVSWDALVGDPLGVALTAELETAAEDFWARYSNLADVMTRLDRNERLPLGTPKWVVHAALRRHFGDLSTALEIIDAASSRGPAAFDYGKIRERFLDRRVA
jgi:uncharacterized protein DUF4304